MAADLEDVAEAGGGEQRGGRALALEDGVGGGGGAVQHVAQGPGPGAGEAERFFDAGDEAGRGIVRRGRGLGDPEPAAPLVHEGHVGEGAADVERDGVARRSSPHDRGVSWAIGHRVSTVDLAMRRA